MTIVYYYCFIWCLLSEKESQALSLIFSVIKRYAIICHDSQGINAWGLSSYSFQMAAHKQSRWCVFL